MASRNCVQEEPHQPSIIHFDRQPTIIQSHCTHPQEYRAHSCKQLRCRHACQKNVLLTQPATDVCRTKVAETMKTPILHAVAKSVQLVACNRGDAIVVEGEVGNHMYLIVSGAAVVEKADSAHSLLAQQLVALDALVHPAWLAWFPKYATDTLSTQPVRSTMPFVLLLLHAASKAFVEVFSPLCHHLLCCHTFSQHLAAAAQLSLPCALS